MPSPVRPILLAAVLAAIVFIVEGLIMLLLPPIANPNWAAAIDATILLLCIWPAIFLLLYRPMARLAAKLQSANVSLEQRVAERTADLAVSNGLLRASEGNYRSLVENLGADLFFYRHDAKGVFNFISPSITDMLGYMPEEFLTHFTKFLTDDPINIEVIRRAEGALRGERQPPYEVSVRHKDGSVRRLEVSVAPIRDQEGRVVAVEGFAFDVTARKTAELEAQRGDGLQKAINQLQNLSLEEITLDVVLSRSLAIILSIPWLSLEPRGAIFIADESANVLRMRAEQGLAAEIRRKCALVRFGQCLCGRAAETGEVQYSDHLDDRHDISYEGIRDHGHYCVPFLFAGRRLGVLNCYLAAGHERNAFEEESLKILARTIAEMIVRKKSEEEKEQLREQFLQAQKMETIGTLAGGVAHDFNNILTALGSEVDAASIESAARLGAPLPHFREMELSIRRAAELTRQLLAFSRRQFLRPEPLILNELIVNLGKMLGRLLGEHIMMDLRLDRDLHPVRADAGQIEQAIINLCVNARDSMPKGGRLTLETRNVEINLEAQHGPFQVPAGRYVRLEITDTGCGMDKETAARIFEPFFTTKEFGHGTGLGLAMVFGIIKQHDGYVYCYSEPGKGTAFKIFLPSCAETPAASAVAAPVATPQGGSETILVAEDEAAVARGVRRTLERLGYQVILARDGQEAVETFERERDRIDLVMLDAVMPRMGGKEAAERIIAGKPGQKLLFTSGYAADTGVVDDSFMLPAGIHFIQKPYSSADLASAVRKALAT